ncbi:MAG: UvrD-helicase domain-containing protein [Ignavibacteriaceae bacterium]|nr:UvrD-helicase domain-containing protein [Ignavibacteriaceae bacterium]
MIKLTPHQSKALNYHNHISLTANAGSGKTFVVSKRFVEIALKENIPLSKIVAITFTDKAASELYKKISDCIKESIFTVHEKSEVKKLEIIRRQLISSNISTIHSFCLNILKEFPVEAELDANIIPIDEKLASELIELSVDRMIKESLENDDQKRIKKLIRMFSSKSILARELDSLVKNYVKIFLIENKIYAKSADDIIEYYNQLTSDYFEKIILNEIAATYNNLCRINSIVLANNPDNNIALNVSVLAHKLISQTEIKELIATLLNIKNIIFTKSGSISARGYLTGHLKINVESECEEIEYFFKQLNLFAINENESEILHELSLFGREILYFFRKSLALYEETKSENGYLDYEDILYRTYNLLKNPRVGNYLSNKYRYLMIDEYQDTNELQYNIFLPLLDNLKKGNLLIVGDEKQSIYMFREADLEVLRKTNEDIANISGPASLLKLPDSFRMKQELCCFTNILFMNLFNVPDHNYNEVGYSELICACSEEEHGEIEFLFNITGDNYGNSESDLVINRLINFVTENEGQYKWGDIAILCRKRKSFTELEKKFAEYNIPFIIMGGKEYYKRQSIYDIYNYFSFLVENENDTALIGLLRSPFFAFSDNDLYNLSLYEDKTYWQKLGHSTKESQKFINVYNLLNENILISGDLEFSLLLRKILKESHYLADLAARADGLQEIANIEKLISLTSDFQKEGYKTLFDFVNFLKSSIEEKDDEPQAPVSEESNAVKIMTIHQSKGLEFPVIVLYKCNDTTINNTIKSKTIIADKTFGLLTKLPFKNNYYIPYQSTSINILSDYIAEKRELAEMKRLLYVGMTRAKERLFVSFEANDELKIQNGSFLWMIKKGLDIDFGKDMFSTKGSLVFLVNDGENYFNKEKIVSINIPINKNIKSIIALKNEPLDTGLNLNIRNIDDHISGEIVSATRFAAFCQCPMKYFFMFEVGLNLIENNLSSFDKDTAEGTIEDSSLKGKIIHTILEEEIKQNDLYNFTLSILDKERLPHDEREILLNDILKDLDNYYSSKIYHELNSIKNYKNEYEVYYKIDGFYLYGRVDKVIFNENKIKIIDYKTDNIIPQNLALRNEQHYSQIKFYSYILSRLFPGINNYEMQIVYIKDPDIIIQYEINRIDFPEIEAEINNMLNSIKNRDFISNIDSCKECFFSINKIKCLKE